ncbi:DUF3054 domain-containing protein [Haloglomus litoreum]|uniref:DUF3054 domain-containing protein n=1 Tax=Haloglomus litoreum TaxID=3034026 RepID=UPI0023E8B59F|nr:DUF3054 domain-containing protein [Haloglomus sp. DT116]
MSTAAALSSRFDRSATTVGLALVDLVLIMAFFVLGELQHGGVAAIPSAPVAAAPFLFGWVVSTVLLGLYGPPWRESLRDAAIRTAGAWTGAVAIGQLLRDSAFLPGNAAPAFILVSLVVGMALLVPWRLAALRFELV